MKESKIKDKRLGWGIKNKRGNDPMYYNYVFPNKRLVA
jgi:hypothetical protein